MLRFNPNTAIKLFYKSTSYIPGQGNATTWVEFTSGDYSTFYTEWKGGYGDKALTAESMGVKDWATLRTFYNPSMYEKLKTVSVVIIKNADATAIIDGKPNKNNMNVYELWGGIDNVLEQNQYMEFKVRRYEGL